MRRRSLLALCGVQLGGLAGCSSAPSDPSPTPTPAPGSISGAKIKWQRKLHAFAPEPYDESILVAVSETDDSDRPELQSFDAATGEREWTIPADTKLFGGLYIDGGAVYTTSQDSITKWELATGTKRWSTGWESISSPGIEAMDASRLYVPNTSPPSSHAESTFPEDLWAYRRSDGALA